jgi:hypothetical protein
MQVNESKIKQTAATLKEYVVPVLISLISSGIFIGSAWATFNYRLSNHELSIDSIVTKVQAVNDDLNEHRLDNAGILGEIRTYMKTIDTRLTRIENALDSK